MHETPPALFEALLSLGDAVGQLAQEERLRAAGLRSALRPGQRRTPLADRERRNQLLEADARAAAFSEVYAQLEELHDVFCPARQPDIHAAHGGLSTARVADDA